MPTFYRIDMACVDDLLEKAIVISKEDGPFQVTAKQACLWSAFGGTDDEFADALLYLYGAAASIVKGREPHGNDDGQLLLYDRGNKALYEWKGHWQKSDMTREDVFAPLLDVFGGAAFQLGQLAEKETDQGRRDALNALRNQCQHARTKVMHARMHGLHGPWEAAVNGPGGLGYSGEDWDNAESISHHIPVGNGVLLVVCGTRSAYLQEYRRRDRFLLRTDVKYREAPKGTLWHEFLAAAFEDGWTAKFLQCAVGHALLRNDLPYGSYMYFLTGPNNREKSLFLRGLEAAFGSLCHAEVYGKSPESVDGNDTLGKALLLFHRVPDYKPLDALAMKRLTKGETMFYKAPGRPFLQQSFSSTAVPFYCVSNEPPKLSPTDYGITRRLVAVPFTASVNENAEAEEKMLTDADELETILKWAVDGAFLDPNMQWPRAVYRATDSWLKALNAS